ncbi:hypothetical protein FAM09_02215 [Niastella caeni]|uniref:Uncharacterized protein n=1 Tax=Niastella caeni TaxID=2569763 RepID=A0A4S8I3S4_9BACT|nr:hypothetical protein [Niastella caeni]THU40952.1 hypothetical protein FAM09_02215 [Niastella caeni]
MIPKTHATREVMRESDRNVYNNGTGTHTRIFDLLMMDSNGNPVYTLHYIHLFDPIFTDTIYQLTSQRLGPAYIEDAVEKKWNAINNTPETNGELGVTVTNGSITINYSGYKERSGYIVELLKNLIKDIDDQLQAS